VNDEAPPLLVGLPPATKLATAAFLLYSSSTSRLFLLRMKRKAPPAIAAMATIPTTTPAAMPALLGPLDFDDESAADEFAELLAVTTMVCPPTVTTDGLAEVVDEGEEDGPAEDVVSALEPPLTVPEPVRYTDKYFPPLEPHISVPYPAQGSLQNESETLADAGGTSLPHQQSVLFVVA